MLKTRQEHAPIADALQEHLAGGYTPFVIPAHKQGGALDEKTIETLAADLAAIAEICHGHGVPVVADDAWGAHFPFHPELPAGSLASGCDIAIGSFHKSLAGLQQASLLSVQGDLVDPTMIEYRVGLVETSSMSPLILASIDLSRRLMALHGEELLSRT